MRRTLSLLKGNGVARADVSRTPGACVAPTADVTSPISTPCMAVLLGWDGRTLSEGYKSRATACSPAFPGPCPLLLHNARHASAPGQRDISLRTRSRVF